jgi:hypothetical protein
MSASKDLAKQPPQEPTWEPSTTLPWWTQRTVGGSQEDSRTGPNTVEASNQSRQIDLHKSGPTGHTTGNC